MIAGTSIEGRPSGIRSRPFGRGNAGRIALTTPILDIEGGDVSTVAFGAGRAGDITINAAHLVVAGEGASQMGSNGGNVTIRANQMVVNRGFVRANAFGGDGGQINIIASALFWPMRQRAQVSNV